MKKLIRITTVPISLEKLLENQARFFKKYYSVTLVSAQKEQLEALAKEQGVAYFPLEMTRKITPLQDLRCLLQLVRFLRKEKPHIVHSHTPKAGIIGMLAAFIARVPVRMHTVAGLPLMEAKGIKKRILYAVERLTYRCATHVYPNSKGLMDFIQEKHLAEKTPLQIIGKGSSNGTDTGYFNNDSISDQELMKCQEKWNIAQDDFVFLFIGRLVGDKGINELVVAFEQLISKLPKAKLLLVGPQEPTLDPLDKSTINAIDQNSRIISTGYQQDVRPFLKMAQVFVFPSYREGFPNVVLQAGAMGVPCIVSDINGCNEIIEDEINGFVVPPKQIQPLVEKMQFLYKDVEKRTIFIERTQTLIATNFERAQYWELLLAEYKRREENV
ncbi:glycosyltransferase family 4 protein [Flavobacteriaceae bacterium]|nr:glycosyltransferase family 4 protein [Flavobacteriaceae bacterium]